ncbi:MAG TPA: sporulation protein [Lachnospiraceae bacterium]|nr:sporulation protein [Lachnospiraceae bacterium]
MEKNNEVFKTTMGSMFDGMDGFLSTKTVVGEPIRIDDTVILPLVDVSFGMAAGALTDDKKNNGAGGMGAKLTPSAVIVIHNGTTRLMNISTHSGIDKILDMVPDFVDRFSNKIADKKEAKANANKGKDPAAREAAAEEIRDKVSDSVNEALEK